MTLERFLDRVDTDATDRSLVVVNRRAPAPVQRMLDSLFDNQSITVEEATLPDTADDTVFLVEDDAVVAASPLSELQDAILFINSDLFTTGALALEDADLPAVLAGLADTRFTVRGYPDSHKEKLLLILVSRHIERHAWNADGGTLRSSFQRLSRIDDEIGTRDVYRRLDDTAVDVNAYGAPGWTPPSTSDITIHAGHERDFLDSWFVVYDPDGDADADALALLAVQQTANEWQGFWTRRPSLVTDLNEYIAHRL